MERPYLERWEREPQEVERPWLERWERKPQEVERPLLERWDPRCREVWFLGLMRREPRRRAAKELAGGRQNFELQSLKRPGMGRQVPKRPNGERQEVRSSVRASSKGTTVNMCCR